MRKFLVIFTLLLVSLTTKASTDGCMLQLPGKKFELAAEFPVEGSSPTDTVTKIVQNSDETLLIEFSRSASYSMQDGKLTLVASLARNISVVVFSPRGNKKVLKQMTTINLPGSGVINL